MFDEDGHMKLQVNKHIIKNTFQSSF